MLDGHPLLRPFAVAIGIASLAAAFALACGPDKQEAPPPFDGRSPNQTGGTSDDDVPAGDDDSAGDDDATAPGDDDDTPPADGGGSKPDSSIKDAAVG